MSSSGVESSSLNSSTVTRRGHQRNSSEDLRLLKEAHSISYAINQIVKNNSLQTDYLRSLDDFVKSIETRLDNVESFFRANNANKKDSLDADSVACLQNLYDTLITIKNSSFTSAANLENFNSLLDDHYDDILPSIIDPSGHLDFHEKVLTALHFIDAKISQFNKLVGDQARLLLNQEETSKENTIESIKEFQVKFHNYEHCLTEGSSRLLHYFELPFPWRENPYIIHGYRFQSNHLHALKSVCQCHNETGNIWTHLLGALLMLYIALVTYPRSDLYHRSTFNDNLIIYLYLAASMKCLLSSAFWHAFSGTSNLYLRKKFACIDYTGITVLITAAVVTTEYSALYYFPYLRTGFIVFSLACGIVGFFFNWTPEFHRPESKPFRIAFYISLACLGLAAFSILAIHKGIIHALKFYSPIVRSAIWYLIGVVFYSSLVPEKFRTDVILDVEQPDEEVLVETVINKIDAYFRVKPTQTPNGNSIFSLWWIDYIFSSHNIWHVFVLLGALGHYAAAYEMFMNIPVNK